MMLDTQFAKILKPLGYYYSTERDNIYFGPEKELIAYVHSMPETVWYEDYKIISVQIIDLTDERTNALRAACVLHEITVEELKCDN